MKHLKIEEDRQKKSKGSLDEDVGSTKTCPTNTSESDSESSEDDEDDGTSCKQYAWEILVHLQRKKI